MSVNNASSGDKIYQSANNTNDGKNLNVVDAFRMGYKYVWEKNLGEFYDNMVDAFLGFPPNIPQDYRDQQFARHLLWSLMDLRNKFKRLFMKGIKPHDLQCIWIRLMPYVTGDVPENLSFLDKRLIFFSFKMYKITKELTMENTSDFDELMNKVVKAVRKTREMQYQKTES